MECVIAPSDADPTREAYFAITPREYLDLIGFHFFNLVFISFFDILRSSLPLSTSILITSPFLNNQIGPPTAASGATCPIISPLVAPENLPSVINATLSPRP